MAKKTHETSSSQLSLDSPPHNNTSLVNEFGDVDLPNLNNFTPNSSTTVPLVNTNMNWPPPPLSDHRLPSLPWPSSLLNPNLSVNSLLLKALQLRTCQQREIAMTDHFASSYIPPQTVSQIMGTNHLTTSNLTLEASSSTKVLDMSQQQQQQQQEQPFNMDSMW